MADAPDEPKNEEQKLWRAATASVANRSFAPQSSFLLIDVAALLSQHREKIDLLTKRLGQQEYEVWRAGRSTLSRSSYEKGLYDGATNAKKAICHGCRNGIAVGMIDGKWWHATSEIGQQRCLAGPIMGER